jgi:hypothetical protein
VPTLIGCVVGSAVAFLATPRDVSVAGKAGFAVVLCLIFLGRYFLVPNYGYGASAPVPRERRATPSTGEPDDE